MAGSRYIPRQADQTVNVSKTHPLAEAGWLVGALSLIGLGLAIVTIFLVDIFVALVSPEREARWFSGLEPEGIMLSNGGAEPSPEIQALFDRVSSHWPDSPYEFRLLISDDEAPNAMALPGGLIIVTEGLLDGVESNNELAFVLAHELGHFHNRDHLRRFGRMALLGTMFSAISGSESIGINLSDLTLRSFSREQEQAADAFGLSLTEATFGHVNGAGDFFERINDGGDSVLARYLDTHPQPMDRLAYLSELAKTEGWNEDGHLEPWGHTDAVEPHGDKTP
ncbi:MAG: M48 family metallopeptidase [Pseudomonadota bacterium]